MGCDHGLRVSVKAVIASPYCFTFELRRHTGAFPCHIAKCQQTMDEYVEKRVDSSVATANTRQNLFRVVLGQSAGGSNEGQKGHRDMDWPRAVPLVYGANVSAGEAKFRIGVEADVPEGR